jgi:hypothetical protein
VNRRLREWRGYFAKDAESVVDDEFERVIDEAQNPEEALRLRKDMYEDLLQEYENAKDISLPFMYTNSYDQEVRFNLFHSDN